MWNCPEIRLNWEAGKKIMADIYELGALAEPLCLWYRENKRSMPWRESPSPYHVWLSEIMLQQTRIEAAKAYYERFIKRLPDVEALAGVPEEELLKLWEGLGYYNRARNLRKAAGLVMERYGGELPADYDLLLELPGIGRYTAGAIASIAYNIPAPAVDGNVLRVAMRYLDCGDDISRASVRTKLERSLLAVIPEDCPGEFNQAIMELGEVICIPGGEPLCGRCPLAGDCLGKRHGRQSERPFRPAKKDRRIEERTVLILLRENRVALRRRPGKGLLAGMWEFPSLEGSLSLSALNEYLREKQVKAEALYPLENAKHIFSHVEWHMCGYVVELPSGQTQDIVPELVWAGKKELQEQYAVPVAFHSFLRQISSKNGILQD